ncbi:copper amine oxidase N-terminal domain-containing protein [Paenibacillus terreus]|uniref:Copper amine oxidase N-terminal domain-containing protein n=1 Tax=Paenibacillus terreus TaxID=1387834 RepID=A0ABV5B8C6_9BACL
MGKLHKNKWKKTIKMIAAASLLVSGLSGLRPVHAAGGGKLEALGSGILPASGSGSMHSIKVTIPASTVFDGGDQLYISLPGGMDLSTDSSGNVIDPMDDSGLNRINILGSSNPLRDLNGPAPGAPTIEVVKADEDSFLLEIPDRGERYTLEEDASFVIQLGDVTWEDMDEGAVEVKFEAPGHSSFPAGKVPIATVGGGKVAVTAGSKKGTDSDYSFSLTLEEASAGALEPMNGSVRVKLPSGYKWNMNDSIRKVEYGSTYGQDMYFQLTSTDDELTVDVLGTTWEDEDGDGRVQPVEVTGATYEMSEWTLSGLKFTLTKPGNAVDGDIKARISGEADLDVTELVVGTHAKYGVTVSAASEKLPSIYAGREEQRISDIVIKEALYGTLPEGRTLTLTLPEGAAFQKVYEGSSESPAGETDNKNDLELAFVRYTGTDDRTAVFEITGASPSSPGTFSLQEIDIVTAPDFAGDLTMEIGGSAGAKGNVKAADVHAGLTVSASDVPDVTIGLSDQEAADFTLVETVAGGLKDGERITLTLSEGVTFAATPTVDVYQGDLQFEPLKLVNNDRSAAFTITGESDESTTLQFSNVIFTLDRTVAEGEIELKVARSTEVSSYSPFKNLGKEVRVPLARVTTSAAEESVSQASFKVGETMYTVNGTEKAADVAPYIHEGRTYLALRYVADALDVSDNNVLWDPETKTVTLIKESRIVQLQAGNTTASINGVQISLDVPITINNGRVFLPIRSTSLSMGASVEWHDTSREARVVKSL